MTHSIFKHFYKIALALATVLLIFVMYQLVGVITGGSQLDLFVRSHVEVLALNTFGVILLFAWIGVYAYQIYKEYTKKVPGTQLAMRILRTITLITFISMAVVYFFSFLALSRGIDNWFELQVGEAVEEATQLRTMIIDTFESNIRRDLKEVVDSLAQLLRDLEGQDFAPGVSANNNATGSLAGESGFRLGQTDLQVQGGGLILGSDAIGNVTTQSRAQAVDAFRTKIFELIFDASQSEEYEEVTYFEDLTSPEGMVVSSSSRPGSFLPVQPSQRLIEQLFLDRQSFDTLGQEAGDASSERDSSWRGRRSSWEFLTNDDGNALLRMLIPISFADQTSRHYLQVLTALPASSQRLAERVSQMKERHERLEYLRNPLKFSFVLALTYVTLMAVLIATWAAIGLTRHLVEPIRTLSEGTKAVAKGTYEMLDEDQSRDDLSVLVESFNKMTRRIKKSQGKIRDSQLLAEKQHASLEIVLKHLSSGVMFVDKDERLTNINLATEKILKLAADEFKNAKLRDMIKRKDVYTPLFVSIAKAVDRKVSDWSETVRLETAQGEQILAYSVTELPKLPRHEDSASASHVVVIEDITALVQAQRGVVWGEVARRMAHEMLNPLQPIQLAVERIQYKTNAHLSSEQSRSLELSFAAISRQLKTLHRIVKEFQDYSKPVVLRKTTLNINELIREVIALHEKNERIEAINLDLDPNLADFQGDPDKLVQVFNNLISNAKEAVADANQVILKIRTRTNEAGRIMVWVIDNGPGFASDVYDRIFEPYATTKKQGMGFGLEIVKRIVEAHGGVISASNNSNGVGAQIQLEFGVNEPRPNIPTEVITVGDTQKET